MTGGDRPLGRVPEVIARGESSNVFAKARGE
jgi:hypothetical protein